MFHGYHKFSSTVRLWFPSSLGTEELGWISSLVFALCSMLLDKKFKSELVRFGAEAAAKLGTRSNRYETLLKQRHVQVSESCLSMNNLFCCFMARNTINVHNHARENITHHARNATQRKAKQRTAGQRNVMQCSATQCSVTQRNATQRNAT